MELSFEYEEFFKIDSIDDICDINLLSLLSIIFSAALILPNCEFITLGS